MTNRVERTISGRSDKPAAINLRIPKKGRIRIILFLVVCAIACKFLLHKDTRHRIIAKSAIAKTQSGDRSSVQINSVALDSINQVQEHTPLQAEDNAAPSTPQKGHSQKEQSIPKENTGFFGGLKLFAKPEIPKSGFTLSDLSALLKKHPVKQGTIRDSIDSENKRYVVHYSLDTCVQHTAETLMRQYHPKYGALIALNSKTGRVLASVSYTRDGEPQIGTNLFVKSIFPAASVFKTVTAAAAIEKGGLTTESQLQLAGRKYTLYKFQLKQDLPASQPVSFEQAYAFSMNPVFARIGLYVVGAAGIKEYIGKFGFNSPIPCEIENDINHADVSTSDSQMTIAEISSGFNQKTRMSPLFGAMLAASVCENGKMPLPTFVDSVTCGDSCTLYRCEPHTWRTPMKQSTASSLKTMMSRVARLGTARTAFRYIHHSQYFDEIDYGGKTGTVDEDVLGKIDWFVGFAENPADSRQHIAVGVVTVHDQFWTVHSSFVAAEIFRKYIRQEQMAQKAEKKEQAATAGIKPIG